MISFFRKFILFAYMKRKLILKILIITSIIILSIVTIADILQSLRIYNLYFNENYPDSLYIPKDLYKANFSTYRKLILNVLITLSGLMLIILFYLLLIKQVFIKIINFLLPLFCLLTLIENILSIYMSYPRSLIYYLGYKDKDIFFTERIIHIILLSIFELFFIFMFILIKRKKNQIALLGDKYEK